MKFLMRWWNGTTEVQHFDSLNDDDSGVHVFPLVSIHHHWTARAARGIVGYCRKHWQFCFGTMLTLIGIYLSYLSLK